LVIPKNERSLIYALVQDSPNPRGVLGSKASGEPSLLLTTSILYALRSAVVSARETLAADSRQSPHPSSAPAPVPMLEEFTAGGTSLAGPTAGRDFFVLAAPATTVKLKQSCGGFSMAEILKSALGRGDELSSSGSESWVEVEA